MEEIIKEKISADHLLYVSLKYTKTCDVIINLLSRWTNMIDKGFNRLIGKAKKEKRWKQIPDAPRARIVQLKRIYSNTPEVMETIELFELFREIEKLDKIRENEFRKGVNLRVTFRGRDININLNQLKEYASTLEKFISYIK